ncbi:MAG: hypothetical protein FWD33_02815 [Alphaproteobacteria bacterium]|nr:hypothetical protein [Alphaproteobacteria bacterium]
MSTRHKSIHHGGGIVEPVEVKDIFDNFKVVRTYRYKMTPEQRKATKLTLLASACGAVTSCLLLWAQFGEAIKEFGYQSKANKADAKIAALDERYWNILITQDERDSIFKNYGELIFETAIKAEQAERSEGIYGFMANQRRVAAKHSYLDAVEGLQQAARPFGLDENQFEREEARYNKQRIKITISKDRATQRAAHIRAARAAKSH